MAFQRLAQIGSGNANAFVAQELLGTPARVPSQSMKNVRLADRIKEAAANAPGLMNALRNNISDYMTPNTGNTSFNTKVQGAYNTLQSWLNTNGIGITPGGLLLNANGISLGKIKKEYMKLPDSTEKRVWMLNASMVNKFVGLLKAIRRYTNALYATPLTQEQLDSRATSRLVAKGRKIKKDGLTAQQYRESGRILAQNGAPQKIQDRFRAIGQSRITFAAEIGNNVIDAQPTPIEMTGVSVGKLIPLKGFKGFKKGVARDFDASTIDSISTGSGSRRTETFAQRAARLANIASRNTANQAAVDEAGVDEEYT